MQLYAEAGAALLEDLQQPPAADRREAVPATGDHPVAVMHVDVIPAGELAFHGRVDLRLGVLDSAQRLVGEHHAEAERVVGRVPFPDGDLVSGAELLSQRGQVQPAGTAAHDSDSHFVAPSNSPGARPARTVPKLRASQAIVN